MHWDSLGIETWVTQKCRFEVMEPGTEIDYKFKYAYWLNEENIGYNLFAEQFLTHTKKFLTTQGYKFQLLNDTDCNEWLILTDYYPHD